MSRHQGIRDWLPWASGTAAGIYALIAWLTVIPNQDLLADGIQVQRVLAAPTLVTSFPGQKHGGVLEYLYGLPAEALFPGNYLAHSAIRVLFAFLTGFLAAKLYRTLFPESAGWSFFLAVCAGPTVLQGLTGPPSNPVGVYWLTCNYDLAWLLVVLGGWLIASGLTGPRSKRRSTIQLIAGGIIVGLGFYQQPTIGLLIAPLAILVAVRCSLSARAVVLVALGAVIGLIPSVVNYVMPRPLSTWDPSHFPVFVPNLAIATLGLDGIPTYFPALFPYALGMAPSESPDVGRVQSVIAAVVLLVIVVSAVVGGVGALLRRERPGPWTAIALAWVGAILAILAFGTVVDPIWFYGAGLAILLWMSVGVLPYAVKPRLLGVILTAVVLIGIGTSTFVHNANWWAGFPERVKAKQAYQELQITTADALRQLGATYVYGSYYDALPVAYGSNAGLHPVTSTYNRFPVDPASLAGVTSVLVAVNEEPPEIWGRESLARVQRECARVGDSPASRPFAVFECPTALLLDPRADG